MPANPDTLIHCPLWHLLNKIDVSIENVEDEKVEIMQDAKSALARGLDAEEFRSAYHRKDDEIKAMLRVRKWIVSSAERGELTLNQQEAI